MASAGFNKSLTLFAMVLIPKS